MIFLTQQSKTHVSHDFSTAGGLYPLSHGESFIKGVDTNKGNHKEGKRRRALLGGQAWRRENVSRGGAGDDIVCHWRKSRVKTEK